MKIFDDTLKVKGKWSRTSLTMFVSFCLAIFIGIGIVIASYFFKITDNRDAIAVFDSFMLLVFGLSGITVFNKLTPSKEENTNETLG
jgi:hypothetical protein